LEWNDVFVIGLEQRIMPMEVTEGMFGGVMDYYDESPPPADDLPHEIDPEECRIGYVAISRAKERYDT
jgi:superfamily I DNA/RNA helicase